MSKQSKEYLKAAKTAVDRKDFDGVRQQCEEVFRIDSSNYTAHVFSGLACLELGRHDDSRRHYKQAIDKQPDGPLAWKGLADFYNKRQPVIEEEQIDALKAYQKLLTFIDSDANKKMSTLLKMAALHRELDHDKEVLQCYGDALAVCEEGSASSVEIPANSLATMATYILGRREDSKSTWTMLEKVFQYLPENDSKRKLRSKFVSRAVSLLKCAPGCEQDLKTTIRSQCLLLIGSEPYIGLQTLVQLAVWETVSAVEVCGACEVTVPLADQHRHWLAELYRLLGDEGKLLGEETTLSAGREWAWSGWALVCVADGKWEDARKATENALSVPTATLCESWLINCIIQLRFHDYHKAKQSAMKGLESISKLPKFSSSKFEQLLKVCLLLAYLGSEDAQPAVELVMELAAQQTSCDSHMTSLVARAYLCNGDIPKAKQVCRELEEAASGDHHLVLTLQGEILLASADYTSATERFCSAIEHAPNSAVGHFLKGLALWKSKVDDKRAAYSSFIQAAKLDPYDPKIFLYIGYYQKLINKNPKRAIKCFQKCVHLKPSLTEAAMELGDLLSAEGEEESAFKVYVSISSSVPPLKAKNAWLRMGLYHRSRNEFSEAINCFQTYIRVDPTDVHCWECVGDTYFARGSYNSALKSFAKCLELSPASVYCLYQVARIKQLLGQLPEAIEEYTTVLQIDRTYVPALKGQCETNLQLAREALENNFDGKAVDYISSALRDLTFAVHLCPQFVCLWKLIGDCCLCLRQLPAHVARPIIPVVLQGQSATYIEDCAIVDKKEVLEIGCRAYTRALQLNPNSAYLWHDLAFSYYHLGQAHDGVDPTRLSYINQASHAAKKAVRLNSRLHLLWNTLGVIAASPEINNFPLSQHSFIRSIQEDGNNPVAWTNLGTLYMKYSHIELAHKAFTNAQSLAPDYAAAWIGQALVAETMGNDEAMDLFRHTTELAYHPEGAMGYGYWVCTTLKSIDLKLILLPGGRGLNDVARKGVSQARDNLQKYVERETDNSCAHNFLGLLFEQEGLQGQAEKYFRKARQIEESRPTPKEVNLTAAKTNHLRVISATGGHAEVVADLVRICEDIPDPSLHYLELALALNRAGEFLKSFKVYENLLTKEVCSITGEQKSAVLTAQAMVAFSLGDIDSCKSLLFRSFQASPVCVHGLVAMCVLGSLSGDLTLVQAALLEMLKMIDSQPDVSSLLHPSCYSALTITAHIMSSQTEAADCVESMRTLLERLPNVEQYSMPPPLPLTLHMLQKDLKVGEIRKLVHSYPMDVWSISALYTHIAEPELRDKYQRIIVQLSANEMATVKVNSKMKQPLSCLRSWATMKET